MDKETRKELNLYRYNDLTAIREHLEKMESEGWQLESLRLFAVYHRCEPQKVRYSAELLDISLISGHSLAGKSRDYIDICEQAGWSFVTNYGPLYIFRTEKEDAPEIVSDPDEKLRNAKRAQFSSIMILVLALFGMFIFSLLSMVTGDFPAIAATRYSFLLIVVCLLLPVGFLVMYNLEFLFWYQKAKRAVRDGLPIPYRETRAAKWMSRCDFVILIAIATVPIILGFYNAMRGEFEMLRQVLFGFGWIAAIAITYFVLKKRKCSSSKTLIVTLAVAFSLIILFAGMEIFLVFRDSQEKKVVIRTDVKGAFVPNRNSIPVTISDLFPEIIESKNGASGEGTILAGLYQYTSEGVYKETNPGKIFYSIYYSPHESLIHSYLRTLEKSGEKDGEVNTGIDAAPWGAKEAYLNQFETDYVIVYDQYVLFFHTLETDPENGILERAEEAFGRLLGTNE